MQSLLDWLLSLPDATLYAVLGLSAALENLFPPFPSDVVVAFGSFVAAQGHRAVLGVFMAVWIGNVSTAFLLYALGRRYGAERLERRLAGKHAASVDARLRALFQRYGLPAVFVSRFVPGVRSVVPAFAGALRLSAWWTLTMVAVASGLWYGMITVVAYRVGEDWELLKQTVLRYSTLFGIGAGVLLVAGIALWIVLHRRRRPTPP